MGGEGWAVASLPGAGGALVEVQHLHAPALKGTAGDDAGDEHREVGVARVPPQPAVQPLHRLAGPRQHHCKSNSKTREHFQVRCKAFFEPFNY